jgi:hypothetical protein
MVRYLPRLTVLVYCKSVPEGHGMSLINGEHPQRYIDCVLDVHRLTGSSLLMIYDQLPRNSDYLDWQIGVYSVLCANSGCTGILFLCFSQYRTVSFHKFTSSTTQQEAKPSQSKLVNNERLEHPFRALRLVGIRPSC